jgi:hypothetical protein
MQGAIVLSGKAQFSGYTEDRPAFFSDDGASSHEAQALMTGFPPPAEQQVTLGNWRKPPFNKWSEEKARLCYGPFRIR